MTHFESENISRLMALGFGSYQRDHFVQAEVSFRQVLAIDPNHDVAIHFLGIIAQRMGRHEEAIDLIARSIRIQPRVAEAHYNSGNSLKKLGRLEEAIAAFRTAVGIKDDYANAHGNLGNALAEQGEVDAAIAAYHKAIAIRPDYAEAYSNLGNALSRRGRLDEAVASFQAAIQLRPGLAEAHSNLGIALKDQGKFDQAIAALKTAIQLRPDLAEPYSNLGIALAGQGKLDEAVASLRRAIQMKPDFFGAYSNLGNVLKDRGELDESIAAYRQSIRIAPDYVEAHGNLILAMHYHPGCDERAIAEEHRRWNRQHAEPLRRFIEPHTNDRNPLRRLRIGYVSGDLRDHPVGRFILPLLARHDKSCFDVFAYSNGAIDDAVTARLRSHTDGWRDITGLSDARAAQLIRQDQIDILIDLSMHTCNNRLRVFARKPAPVQVTYLALTSNSGLEAIDYRLSDPYLDPVGCDESVYIEKTIRLPETYWCYDPAIVVPEVSRPPVLDRGFVAFGSLNNFCKISGPTLSAWAKILRGIPSSRLLVHAREGSHRQLMRERLAREGVDPDRVQFAGHRAIGEYFRLYGGIDIALDTFPFAGGTTTCDALWMGVPVISLACDRVVGRGGLSILSNVGLAELVARSDPEYVQIAMNLAADLPRIADIRSTLRARMLGSPLMDAGRFARGVEEAYRVMWRGWCGT